jgi:3-methyladenine DNA glycosylase AlkD
MNVQEALDTLKSLGTEQNRKIYRRHGAREDVYGVSYAHLKDLKKKVKVNHELAEGLWRSGNHDARIFATMVADPKRLDREALDIWVRGLAGYPESDAFGDLAAKSPAGREALERYTGSDEEWTAAARWRGLAHLVMNGGLSDEECEKLLARIEREIHSERNRVRYEMNNVVIAIGTRNPDLQEKAIAAATRIGKVEVDHGETGCKTPEAVSYIRKVAERKKK